MFSRSVLRAVHGFIHRILIDCAMGAYVLIWILELMEKEVNGNKDVGRRTRVVT